MPLGTELGLSPGDSVFDGDPAHLPRKRGQSPQKFSAHVHCCQTTEWIKVPLDKEVGLGPGNFMFDGDPATTRTEGTPTTTQFLAYVYCGQSAGLMKMPLGTEVDFGPGHIVLDWVPALRERGTAAPPHLFRHMSIVATVAHLSFC